MKGLTPDWIKAAALRVQCPRCMSMPYVNCKVMSKGVVIGTRLHKERIDLGLIRK